jgi:hypothetical protein
VHSTSYIEKIYRASRKTELEIHQNVISRARHNDNALDDGHEKRMEKGPESQRSCGGTPVADS